MYYVYLLECADGSIYTGITTDLKKRFERHAQGSAARYTRAKKAVRMLYAEEQPSRSAATKRELQIKSWPRQKKLDLIAANLHARKVPPSPRR